MIVRLSAILLMALAAALPARAQDRPTNVVLIIVDDMGMGDFASFGNPVVIMPNLEQLHDESIRLTDFHVDPTCSPTRAALMTGQHSLRTGVWHTIMARHQLKAEAYTMAELFLDNGYATGAFGKWHLGDSYPMRAMDQGFTHSVVMGGGGVGQTPDYWGNTHFGGTYWVDGEPTLFAANATDVWFDTATAFITREAQAGRPFFAYIATNAAHTPWRGPQNYVQPYLDMGLTSSAARYYGMVSHVDARLGQLRAQLEALGVEEDTILLFTSDNGTALNPGAIMRETGKMPFGEWKRRNPATADWQHNAGLRGYKAAVTDGGHRVPLFLHWPAGGFAQGRSEDVLAAHFDVMPTLVDLLGLVAPAFASFDGRSLQPALRGETMADRTLVVTNQRVPMANPERPAQVMTENWRYLPEDGSLYAIEQDPGQKTDVAADYPQVVAAMQAAYASWWREMAPTLGPRERPIVDGAEEILRLTSHDFAFAGERPEAIAWYPGFGDDAWGNYASAWIGSERDYLAGPLEVAARQAGRFRIALYYHDKPSSRAAPFGTAHLTVNGAHHSAALHPAQDHAIFELDLPAGDIDLVGWFSDEPGNAPIKGKSVPAFFVYVEKLSD